MKAYPTTSIIVSVYKKTDDLAVVLTSLASQTVASFDVIISEDGESNEMKTFVAQYSGPLTIKHLTQQDNGWQKNKALNQAIKKSTSDYLIFIDGDCVLHPKFVEEHLKRSETKSVLAGRRVKLGPKASIQLRKKINPEFLSKQYPLYIFSLFSDKGSFIDEGIYSPFLAKQRTSKTLKGCNFSCYKSALETINGLDENYIKPAVGEDTDLDWRFEGMGFTIKSVRHLAIQYHLYHQESWTDVKENMAYMNQQQTKKAFVAENGLKKKHSNRSS